MVRGSYRLAAPPARAAIVAEVRIQILLARFVVFRSFDWLFALALTHCSFCFSLLFQSTITNQTRVSETVVSE
jgi:hypothetical protein